MTPTVYLFFRTIYWMVQDIKISKWILPYWPIRMATNIVVISWFYLQQYRGSSIHTNGGMNNTRKDSCFIYTAQFTIYLILHHRHARRLPSKHVPIYYVSIRYDPCIELAHNILICFISIENESISQWIFGLIGLEMMLFRQIYLRMGRPWQDGRRWQLIRIYGCTLVE